MKKSIILSLLPLLGVFSACRNVAETVNMRESNISEKSEIEDKDSKSSTISNTTENYELNDPGYKIEKDVYFIDCSLLKILKLCDTHISDKGLEQILVASPNLKECILIEEFNIKRFAIPKSVKAFELLEIDYCASIETIDLSQAPLAKFLLRRDRISRAPLIGPLEYVEMYRLYPFITCLTFGHIDQMVSIIDYLGYRNFKRDFIQFELPNIGSSVVKCDPEKVSLFCKQLIKCGSIPQLKQLKEILQEIKTACSLINIDLASKMYSDKFDDDLLRAAHYLGEGELKFQLERELSVCENLISIHNASSIPDVLAIVNECQTHPEFYNAIYLFSIILRGSEQIKKLLEHSLDIERVNNRQDHIEI